MAATVVPAQVTTGDVRVYEYGARLDKECIVAAGDQIAKARRLYNAIVACMRDTMDEMRAFLLDRAGPDAVAAQQAVDAGSAAFAAAKAANDEDAMREAAQARRSAWRDLAVALAQARKEHRSDLQSQFLSRIGRSSTCETYQLRCAAVADGLGWATANATLDAALNAFKKTISRGQAPRFAKGSEIIQDALTLQFTAAGGMPVGDLLAGKNSELTIFAEKGCGRRCYGTFSFKLGAAKADCSATGTWQYHRALPADGSVGLARLVRRKIGPDFRWWIQFQVRSPLPAVDVDVERQPLAAVHFGWAADVSGRRVAGIAAGADPGQASIVRLPPDVEADLARASEIDSARSTARDEIVARIKAHAWPMDDAPDPVPDAEPTPAQRAKAEVKAVRRLPATHVAASRLHRVARLLRDSDLLPDWFEAWRKQDRLAWQAGAHLARRARNRRRDFYRKMALDLAASHRAIVIEPLDLAKAAIKVDEATGERTEFSRKARSGRVVAAVYEFESALRWAATKCACAVLDLSAETVACCAYCGGPAVTDDVDAQRLHCHGCGAEIDRKQNGAARAWQIANDSLDALVADFWTQVMAARREAEAKQAEKKRKLAEGRAKARMKGAADAARAVE